MKLLTLRDASIARTLVEYLVICQEHNDLYTKYTFWENKYFAYFEIKPKPERIDFLANLNH